MQGIRYPTWDVFSLSFLKVFLFNKSWERHQSRVEQEEKSVLSQSQSPHSDLRPGWPWVDLPVKLRDNMIKGTLDVIHTADIVLCFCWKFYKKNCLVHFVHVQRYCTGFVLSLKCKGILLHCVSKVCSAYYTGFEIGTVYYDTFN